MVLLLVIGGVWAIGALTGESSPDKTSSNGTETYRAQAAAVQEIAAGSVKEQQAAQVAAETKRQNAEQSPRKMGDNLKVGHFWYRVKDVSFSKTIGSDMLSETADGVFAIVGISVQNSSNETRTLDGSMFKMVDSQGREFEHSVNGSTALEMSGQKTLFLKQCQPGILTSGKLIFEVPTQKDSYALVLSGGFWSADSAKVSLE